MEQFTNRREAGQRLAHALTAYADRPDVIVLALPRGGVPVATEVAEALHATLDVLIVRKLGAPWNEEFAIGAVASGGTCVLDSALIRQLRIARTDIEEIIARELHELERRERVYRDRQPWPMLRDRTVILVDDGVATGATMTAAVRALRQQSPHHIVVATPVASATAYHALQRIADDCVALIVSDVLYGVGMYYRDFSQTTDEEVQTLLERAAHHTPPTQAS
jgi:predicted phosphoribosyltransferase